MATNDGTKYEGEPMGEEELARLAWLLAQPVDFDELIENGVLEKHGSWYVIRDRERVPEQLMRRANAFKTPNLVRFSKHSTKLWDSIKRTRPELARRVEAEPGG